jgi:diadenosine tetraphosphate (Ap4A) HIT family hydrolase
MNRKDGCAFCKHNFPDDYQLVSKEPEYWVFLLNRDPQCDYHGLIVLKAEAIDKLGHISDLGDDRLPEKAMKELGILLGKACISIKSSDPTIERLLIASLNTGQTSHHLHFHLIPKRYDEPVKVVNKPCENGGGMFFLARKEIVVDTFSDYLKSTTGNESDKIIDNIKDATKCRISENVTKVRNNFKWKNLR